MKNTIKSLALLLICMVSVSVTAQNLVSKISDRASLVLELNGENMFKDVSVLELENSLFFKEVTKEVFRRSEMEKPSNFADMGVNMSSKMYFAIENEKDITYYYYTCAIENPTKFNAFVKSGVSSENGLSLSKSNGLNQIIFDNTSRIVWNETYFIFTTSIYTGEAFQKDYYYSWYDNDYENEYMEAEAATEAVEEVYEIEETTETVEEVIETETAYDYDYESDYDKRQKEKRAAFDKKEEEKEKKKISFIDSALTARTTLFFTNQSINEFVPIGFDANAVASVWYNGMDVTNLSNPFNRMLYGYRGGYKSTPNMLGLQSLYSAGYYTNLYLEEDKISLRSNVEFSDNLKEAANKIYNSKLDKNFGKYLTEDMLAYTTFSMNTEDLLNESANISKDYLKQMSDFEYSEEVSVYIDFLQIMLDEEAIAELVTGDVVMLLHDLKSKQVEYKTWEYDENFNESEVTKTKNEQLPEFTFMMGSQNEEMLTKLFKLSVKHNILKGIDSYFLASAKDNRELPFDMYISFKDGILFMTNSQSQLQTIINGKAENKISKAQRKHIMKSIGTVYIDMEQITAKLLADESLGKELSELNAFKDDMKQVIATSSYKNNTYSMDANITIPESETNSSTYLLKLVDKIITESKK